jgi:hypothetical protein
VALFDLIAYEALAVPPLPVVPDSVVVPPVGARTWMLTGTPGAATPPCATLHAIVAYTDALRFAGRVYVDWSVETITASDGLATIDTSALTDAVAAGAAASVAAIGIVYVAAAAELGDVTVSEADAVAPGAMLAVWPPTALHPVGTLAATMNDVLALPLFVTPTE